MNFLRIPNVKYFKGFKHLQEMKQAYITFILHMQDISVIFTLFLLTAAKKTPSILTLWGRVSKVKLISVSIHRNPCTKNIFQQIEILRDHHDFSGNSKGSSPNLAFNIKRI